MYYYVAAEVLHHKYKEKSGIILHCMLVEFPPFVGKTE
jgi:hypothetical protein